MALAQAPLVPKDGTLVITDNAGTPLSLTVQYEDGDFSIDNMQEDQWEVQTFLDRGTPYSVRRTEKSPLSFSFSAHAVALLGDGTTAGLADVVLKKGVWASASSKLPTANGDAYLVQVAWTGERSDFGASADAGLTLKYCRLKMSFAEGVPGKINITGECIPLSTDYMTVA